MIHLILAILYACLVYQIIDKTYQPLNGFWSDPLYILYSAIYVMFAYITIPTLKELISIEEFIAQPAQIFFVLLSYTLVILMYSNQMIVPRRLFGKVNLGLIQPIFEEVVFRGVILFKLRNLLPNWPLIYIALINAAIFSLYHLNYWRPFLKHKRRYFYFFLHGYVFAYLALSFNSILFSVLAHVYMNGGNILYTLIRQNNARERQN